MKRSPNSQHQPRRTSGMWMALLLGLFFSLCLVVALEIGLRLFPQRSFRLEILQPPITPSRPAKEVAFPSYVKDPFVAIRQKLVKSGSLGPLDQVLEKISPDSYRVVKRTAQGDLVYDVTYRHRDERRITPGQPPRGAFAVILMGCSFTFGEGLEEDQTVAAFLQRRLKNAAVHNAAWHGWGPGDALLSLQQSDPKQWPSTLKSLPQAPKTIGVFVLGYGHFDRIECNLDCHQPSGEWLRWRPDFQPDEKGELVYRGRMRETRDFPRWLEILADSAIVKQFNLTGIGRFSRARQEKMAKLLTQIRDELDRRSSLDDFYVLYHPQGPLFDFVHLNEILRKNGIKILRPDLNLSALTGERYAIPGDGHPTPQQNFLLADYLSSALKRDKPKLEWRNDETNH